jgi:hypothetical protein
MPECPNKIYFIRLCDIVQNDILPAISLKAFLLSAVMLNVIVLYAVILSVILLCSHSDESQFALCYSAER